MITEFFECSAEFMEFAERVAGIVDYYRSNIAVTCVVADSGYRESLSGILAAMKKIPDATQVTETAAILTYGAGKNSANLTYTPTTTEKNSFCSIL